MTPPIMTKAWLRANYLTQRKALDEATYQVYNQCIHTHFFSYWSLAKLTTLHIYLSNHQQKEVATWPIIATLQQQYSHITIAVPKISDQNGRMVSYRLTQHTQWQRNGWGIVEPREGQYIPADALDCIILPLIVFDQQGYRVGYGKGYYDRFLKKCKTEALKIGLCFEAPVHRIEDIDAYDVRMDYCITPAQIFAFT